MKKRGEKKYIKDLSVNIDTFINDDVLNKQIRDIAIEVQNGNMSSLFQLTNIGESIKQKYPYYASTKVILHIFRCLKNVKTVEEANIQFERLGIIPKKNVVELTDTYTPLSKKEIKQLTRGFKLNEFDGM